MELPSKIIKQISFRTRPKVEEHMLIVKDKSIHEEHLSQPSQTDIRRFKKLSFLYLVIIGIFNVTKKKTLFRKINFLIKIVLFKKLFHRVLTK